MTRPTGNSYYVRTRGRVQGPLSLEKLKLLRARGQFGRASEVSLDGILWSPASDFRELFEREPAAASQPVAAGPEAAIQPVAADLSPAGVTVPRDPGVPWKPLLLAGAMLTMSVTLVITAWLATRDRDLTRLTAEEPVREEIEAGDETMVEDTEVPVDESDSNTAPDGTSVTNETTASGVQKSVDESITVGSAAAPEPTSEQPSEETVTKDQHDKSAESSTTPESPSSDVPQAQVIESAIDPASEDAREAAIGLVVCGYTCGLRTGFNKEVMQAFGSCFAVSPSGYAITNRHVLDDTLKLIRSKSSRTELESSTEKATGWSIETLTPTVWVFLNGKRQVATIEHSSVRFDFGVLKLNEPLTSQFALAADPELTKGTTVYAVGFPDAAKAQTSEEGQLFTWIRAHVSYSAADRDTQVETVLPSNSFDFTITSGIISRRKTEDDGTVWVQHDAPFSGGNSGGPLVLSDGRVLGINTLTAHDAQGIFLALSMPQLREEIDAHIPGVVWK